MVSDHDPARLLGQAPGSQPGRRRPPGRRPPHDRNLPALGALDTLEPVVLPLLPGAGMRLTDSLSPDTGLAFERERAFPADSVEIVYACQVQRDQLPGRPASRRPNA